MTLFYHDIDIRELVMKKINEQGFTLIELMIVVAIIGILATIAVPAYSNYITRAQVSEALTMGAGLKSPLSDYSWQKSSWPTRLVDVSQSPQEDEINATLTGKYASITDTINGAYPSGEVVLTMITGKASGQTILMRTTDGASTWTCTPGTLDPKYRPNACR